MKISFIGSLLAKFEQATFVFKLMLLGVLQTQLSTTDSTPDKSHKYCYIYNNKILDPDWFFARFFQTLRDQLDIALENERRAKEELETLKEEMKAERASVQAARVIEKQKREVGINRQMAMFKQSQEAVNQRVDSLVTSIGELSKVHVVWGGVKHGRKIILFYIYI